VPDTIALGQQLALFMADQHLLQLKNNPYLQDMKEEYRRDDFVYAGFFEDNAFDNSGRFIIESFAARPVLYTSTFVNPNPQQGTIYSQVAIRPNLKSVVNATWPLPPSQRAVLMAAVARCQNDAIENLDPEGCLKAVANKLGLDMDIKPDPATNAFNAVIRLPTTTRLPGRAIVEPLSLWFGARICKRSQATAQPPAGASPAAPSSTASGAAPALPAAEPTQPTTSGSTPAESP
jgi:hypothetical protein